MPRQAGEAEWPHSRALVRAPLPTLCALARPFSLSLSLSFLSFSLFPERRQHKAPDGQAPSYLKELIVPYHPTRALRSQNAGLLVVPRVFKSTMGGKAFNYQAPLLWNHLPDSVRGADTLSTLRVGLKPSFLIKLIVRCLQCL